MYEIKNIENGSKGLFYKGVFCGLYSQICNEIIQFSGNKNQIFNADICANYLLQTNDIVYSSITVAGNQYYLRVTVEPHVSEGVLTKHVKQLGDKTKL